MEAFREEIRLILNYKKEKELPSEDKQKKKDFRRKASSVT